MFELGAHSDFLLTIKIPESKYITMIGVLETFLWLLQKPLSDEAISYGLYAMGKIYSLEREWKKALKCLNWALVLQRSSLGEDNEITECTLLLIATCLMYIGEKLLALVAFEEAMYIRMKNYEEGDETARIAADEWSLLHNNRLKVMKCQEEKNGLKYFIYTGPKLLGNIDNGYEDDDLDEVDLSDSTKINKWRRGVAG